MIQIDEAIIVEGKYDKIKLSSILDTLILEVNGFHIFKDKEKIQLIKTLAETRGIIVLTDSDDAGNIIRNKINSITDSRKVYNAYIPQIVGKEKRKTVPSKQGFLGVEGINKEIILNALSECGINCKDGEKREPITNADLYDLGYTGTSNSKYKRKLLLKHLGLPDNISKNNLLRIISYHTNIENLIKITSQIEEEIENGGKSQSKN